MKIASYAKSEKFIGRGLDAFGLKSQLLQEVGDRTEHQKNLSLLEVGCGQGNLLLDLLKLYPNLSLSGINKEVTHGVKHQGEVTKRTAERSLNTKNTPKIYFGDATKLPFNPETFDLVISQVTFIHIENKATAIKEVYRVLKVGGTALISLGSYGINRQHGHAMPTFYKSLREKFGYDFNPRFLVRSNNRFISLSEFMQKTQEKYNIKLQMDKFVSESQRGVAQWLIINKRNKENLSLGLTYNREESRKLTEAFAKKNPVNWGVIDLYQLV